MVVYPCLLGGVMATMLGSGTESWIDGIVARFFKGLLAGFVLGSLYMFILNVTGAFIIPIASQPDVQEYHHMMWWAGTIAMSIASAAFLVLFHWAAGLGRTALVAGDMADKSIRVP